jgi:hypothetical protein
VLDSVVMGHFAHREGTSGYSEMTATADTDSLILRTGGTGLTAAASAATFAHFNAKRSTSKNFH